jgi:NADH:ubiquinone oxidoreductase subunit 6 (subunit J)
MTMPITLIIASNTLYSSKGFAFGLTTLALFVGAIPTLLKITILPFNTVSVIVGVIISAIVFYIGAYLYDKKQENEKC